MPKARIKRIHVNQHIIRANRKALAGTPEPVLTVKVGKENHYGFEVNIQGPSVLIYRPEKPLACGAHVWIETRAPVSVDGCLLT